jgi:two-component system, NtrC family, response regulator HydG
MGISERKYRPQYLTDVAHRFIAAAPHVKEVLFVDPDADQLSSIWGTLRFVAEVEVYQEFQAARARLLAKPPDLLVTNLRLGAYNGLHLVHMAQGTPTRCVVYASHNDDEVLIRQVKDAGAFFERSVRLPRVIASYVRALLPPCDQRDPRVLDRRQTHRGGRRCTDL